MIQKLLILTVIYPIIYFPLFGQSTNASHLIKVKGSAFTIEGSTNISSFQCYLTKTNYSDTIAIERTWRHRTITFDRLTLKYPVNEFDCQIELMTEDLQSLLQSDRFPYLFLRVKTIEVIDGPQEIENLDVSSEVNVTIAGVTREVRVDKGSVVNHSESLLTFQGKVSLDMVDFGIEPPVKFFGMVKVDNLLEVSFSITMEVTDLK